METISITSFDQIPAGINYLIDRLNRLEAAIKQPAVPTQPFPTDQLLTRNEAAKRLRITLATLRDYTKTGKVVAQRIGGRVLYKEADILAALTRVDATP